MDCWWSNLKFNKLKQKIVTDNMFKKVKRLSCKSFQLHQSTAGLVFCLWVGFFVLVVWGGVGVGSGFFATSYMPTKHRWVRVTLIWDLVNWYWKEMSVSPIDTMQHTPFWLASSEQVPRTVKQQYTIFHNLRAL